MRRDEQILQAAEDLFYERSFAAVSVDEIGKRAGIAGPSIYKHFSNKAEILTNLLERAGMALLISVAEPRDDPWLELTHIVRGHVAYVITHHKLVAIWVREARSLRGDERRRMERRDDAYTARVLAVLRRCFPGRTEPELLSAMWMMIYQLSCIGLWPEAARQTPGLADLMIDTGINALAVLGEPPIAAATESLDADTPRNGATARPRDPSNQPLV